MLASMSKAVLDYDPFWPTASCMGLLWDHNGSRAAETEPLLFLFSPSVVSGSVQPHRLQLARLLCPPLSTGICSNSCPLSQWCYPALSPSASLVSFCLQSFLGSESFPVNPLLHQVPKVLEFQLQHLSFQWIFRVNFLKDWLAWSP